MFLPFVFSSNAIVFNDFSKLFLVVVSRMLTRIRLDGFSVVFNYDDP